MWGHRVCHAPLSMRSRSIDSSLILVSTALCLVLLAPAARAMPNWAKQVLDSVPTATPDPEASAWILHHSVDVSLHRNGRTRSHTRLLVKVLQKPGARYAAVTELVFPERVVKALEGWLKRADGSEEHLTLRDAVRFENEVAAGYYDDQQVLVAAWPHTTAGCVAAFEYEVEDQSWTNPYLGLYFQRQEPVRFVSYRVRVAKGWQLEYQLNNAADVEFARDEDQFAWTARDLCYRKAEPLMPPWNAVSPRLDVVCRRVADEAESAGDGWNRVARHVSELMAKSSMRDSTIDELAARLVDTMSDPAASVEAIGRYVRDQVRYVAVEIGEGRIRPRPAEVTLHNLYGDCKDKTALTRALLGAVGIESAPVLACVGEDIQPQLPTGAQFNHCIVAIPSAALDLTDTAYASARVPPWLFFDPTAEHVQFGHVPEPMAGQHVLVCSESEPSLVRLPRLGAAVPRRHFAVQAELTPAGDLRARVDVTETYPGQTRESLARRYADRTKSEERWRARVHTCMPAAVLSEFRSTEWDDSAHVYFELAAAGYARPFGPEFVLNPVPVQTPRPPELTDSSRTFPIDFGKGRVEEFEVHWNLPASMQINALPEDMLDSSLAGRVQRRIWRDSAGIGLHVSCTYAGAPLPVGEYATAQAFDLRVSSAVSMQIILEDTTDTD